MQETLPASKKIIHFLYPTKKALPTRCIRLDIATFSAGLRANFKT
jgi:hypothetical protein